MYLYFDVTGVNTGDTFSVSFYTPSGQGYAAGSGTFAAATSAGEWCYSTTNSPLLIAGNPPATMPGTWTVYIYYNGSAFAYASFTIAPPGGGTAPSTVTMTEYPVITANSAPWGVAAGPDGNVWFTEMGKIGKITPAGAITEYALRSNQSRANAIVAGPDGAMWFVEENTQNVGRITTSGSITEYPTPAQSRLGGIAAGPDGAMWFTDTDNNKIGRMTAGGNVVEYSLPTANEEPGSIAAGPDGAMWFTEDTKIGRITTAGAFTEYAIPTGSAMPWGIVAGPDSALWFTEEKTGKIGRITTAGVITEYAVGSTGNDLTGIAAGPASDGALWFCDNGANKIGRISTSGAITEYAVTSSGAGLRMLVAGPDGDIWFAEQTKNQIGRAVLPVVCSYLLSANPAPFAAAGGSGSFSVTAGTGCTWTAAVSSSATWITITSGASGTGNGTVNYTVAANTSTSSRTGTITVQTQTFTITQAAASVTCSYSLSATSATVAAGGGSGFFTVTTGSGCTVSASSDVTWITPTVSGSTVNYTVTANTSTTARTGHITVGTQTFTVTQTGASGGGVTTGNLIQNGDAESGPAAPNAASVPSIPGWTTDGGAAVVAYTDPSGDLTPTDPGPPNRGNNYFAGGTNNASATMTQTINLSSYAAAIDTGTQAYTLDGWLGGWDGQDDNAVLTVTFLSASGATLGSAKIGPVLSADRGGVEELLERTATGTVPTGTRSALISLVFTRVSGTYNDGCADNLSFALTGGGSGTTATGNFTYNGFGSTAGLTLVGNAATASTSDGTVLRLTPAAGNQTGAVYSTTPVTLGNNATFSTQFQFRLSNPGGTEPADGIVFVLGTSTKGLGGLGVGMGYQGVSGNSVGIEFDTYNNTGFGLGNDDGNSSNHVAIDTNGTLTNTDLTNVYGIQNCVFTSGASAPNSNTAAGCMSNGDLWTVNINYDGSNLTVTLTDPAKGSSFTAINSYAINLASILGQTTAYVGFTAGTGAGWENHDIVNWTFANSAQAVGTGTGTWTMLTTSGDCSGNDVSSSSGSSIPDPTKCTSAFNGFTAVCWPSSSSWDPNSCTYKNVPAASCTGGSHPSYLYRCDASSAGSTPITITDPGFETIPSNVQWVDCSGSGGAGSGGTGCRDTLDGNIPGWTTSSGGQMGLFQPGPNYFTLPLPTAEGQTVAQVNSGTLSQVLSATLQVSTLYTLQVDVGRRLDNLYPSPPPTVQLFAGNTLIASATGAQPPLGGWTTWTGTYQSSASDPLAGQTLKIVLSVTAPQGDFDNVRLTAAGGGGGTAACTYSLSASSASVGAAQSTGNVTVTASAASCAWTVANSNSWITITSATSFTGTGTVNYTVAANTGAARSGTLTIAGVNYTVSQAGTGTTPGCNYNVTLSQSVAAAPATAGGNITGMIYVYTNTGCAWTAVSNTSWITIVVGASGTANGAVQYKVDPNTATTSRTGTMTVAGQTVTISQAAAAPCTYSISPTSNNVQALGGGSSIAVTAGNDCAWTASVSSSASSWLHLGSTTSGTGNGSVSYTVDANTTTASRTGTMTVAGQTFTVTQAGGASATGPTIASILNAVNYRTAIAQGSFFTIFGTNLGPAAPQQATQFPIPDNMGGVTVTVGSATKRAYLLYVSATQINAIMPSDAPQGNVQVTVNYNGSASASATIVQIAFGINSTAGGPGPGIVNNYNSATDQPLNTASVPAKPGQVEILVGTGLGPITVADNQPPPVGVPTTPVQVWVGGQQASVSYSGRAPGFAGQDQINFTVPAGAATGCSVPVQVLAGTTWSNTVRMAISSDGSHCQDAFNPYSGLSAAGGNSGTLGLIRVNFTGTVDPTQPPTTATLDLGVGAFAKTNPGGDLVYSPITDLPPVGTCASTNKMLDLGAVMGSGGSTLDPTIAAALDAGPQLNVSGGANGATGTLTQTSSTSPYMGLLGGNLSGATLPPPFLDGGPFTISGPGGKDVGPFTTTIALAPTITWTNPPSTINRSSPLTLTWTGGDPSQAVLIMGGSTDQTSQASGGFLCLAPVSARTFTVPVNSLADLIPTGAATSSSGPVGMLGLMPLPQTNMQKLSAPGLTTGIVFDTTMTVQTVQVQ